jgi:hypothetical protein
MKLLGKQQSQARVAGTLGAVWRRPYMIYPAASRDLHAGVIVAGGYYGVVWAIAPAHDMVTAMRRRRQQPEPN